MFEINLSVNQSNQRLDKVLKKYLKNAPPSFIYKMLRKKNITLNGQKAIGNEITVAGDTVQFFLSGETYDKMRSQDTVEVSLTPDFPEIRVLFEDADVCLFIKPPGILSQKALPTDFSVNEWVVYHATELGIISNSVFETFRPSVVNRLDRNTGGIMMAGLSVNGLQVLTELIRERKVRKYYYALVKGLITEPGEIRGFLEKDEARNRVMIFAEPGAHTRPIHTAYEPLGIYHHGEMTLLRVDLLTGRPHQIRAHLASIGHPILGDRKYGDDRFNMRYRCFSQCLFAYELKFPKCSLPGVSEKTFTAEVPKDWPLGTAED